MIDIKITNSHMFHQTNIPLNFLSSSVKVLCVVFFWFFFCWPYFNQHRRISINIDTFFNLNTCTYLFRAFCKEESQYHDVGKR
jgi:hypothetical protein